MDSNLILRAVLALLFVSSLIILIALLVKKLGLSSAVFRQAGTKRLAIVEVMVLDPKRRLVIVRRDQVEHVILLGLSSETILETYPQPQEAEILS
jgi:flagellar protein FliO/FliZ